MFLDRKSILTAIDCGEITIAPPPSLEQVNTSSINLRIGPKILQYRQDVSPLVAFPVDDPENRRTTNARIGNLPEDFEEKDCTYGMTLYPGNFYLGSTYESVGSQSFHMQLHGRSSAARMGLSIHETAGFGDIGFEGCWTLEISPKIPIRIYAYQYVAQMSFSTMLCRVPRKHRYKGKHYTNHGEPIPSRGLGPADPPKELVILA